MNLHDLDTPSLVVDLDRLERNVKAMSDLVRPYGVRLRPHVKTHKTVEIARLQMKYGAAGLTVAKIGEAEVMAEAGFDDLLIANIVIGKAKLERLARLVRTVRIKSCVDSLEGAAMMSEMAVRYGVVFDVMLDVNSGLNRTGILPEQAILLGKEVAKLPGLRLCGVFTYGGYGPPVKDDGLRNQWARREAETAVFVARELENAGIAAAEVSVAGTPTSRFGAAVAGVTEVRPGTYVFNDANYVRLGFGTFDDCALRIRARVISRPAADRAVIDAGSKVLTSEKPVRDGQDVGYGHIVGLPDSKIAALWEEHGVVHLCDEGRQLKIGDVIEIIPNHVCPAVNLADCLYGVRGDKVEGIFAVAARGKVQ